MIRCGSSIVKYGPALEAVRAASLLVATSSFNPNSGVYLYRASFWLDSWHEQAADSPQCLGNHRSHEAAANCALRFANRLGYRCFTLEQHPPQPESA